MSRNKLQVSENAGGNTMSWLTTFNDLVTLLMVFFVLLFTMSTIDTKKMKNFQYALQSGLGALNSGGRVSISVKNTQPIDDMSHIFTQAEELDDGREQSTNGFRQLVEELQKLKSEYGINSTLSEEGARIFFEDHLLFEFGGVDIDPQGLPMLDKIARVLKEVPFPIRVEGHTDNVPIRTRRFQSNWELSVARAVNVVKYFVDVNHIDPRRLSAVGYGESRPVAANTSPANRARNRRVEIVLNTKGMNEHVE
jgi:chemotaxis protein MotB